MVNITENKEINITVNEGNPNFRNEHILKIESNDQTVNKKRHINSLSEVVIKILGMDWVRGE